MLSPKGFTTLFLACCLFISFHTLTADAPQTQEKTLLNAMNDPAFARAFIKEWNKRKPNRLLKLADFAGSYSIELNSISGISGPDANGVSLGGQFQLSLGRDGRGHVNAGTLSIYTGSTGDVKSIVMRKSTTVELVISAAKHSAAEMRINIPDLFGQDKTFIIPIIAIRSVNSGKVLEFKGVRTEVLPENLPCQKALVQIFGQRLTR